jgi:hypothetical protein
MLEWAHLVVVSFSRMPLADRCRCTKEVGRCTNRWKYINWIIFTLCIQGCKDKCKTLSQWNLKNNKVRKSLLFISKLLVYCLHSNALTFKMDETILNTLDVALYGCDMGNRILLSGILRVFLFSNNMHNFNYNGKSSSWEGNSNLTSQEIWLILKVHSCASRAFHWI